MAPQRPKYLFDTSVFIHYWRGHQGARSIIVNTRNRKWDAGFSILTIAELWSGVRNQQQAKDQVIILSPYRCYPLIHTIAKRAGELRWLYKTSLSDALIAATAEHYDLILVSGNTNHFDPLAQAGVIKFQSY